MKNNSPNLLKIAIVAFIVFCLLGTSTQLMITKKIEGVFSLEKGTLQKYVSTDQNGGGNQNEKNVNQQPSEETFDESRYLSHSQSTIEYFKKVAMGREFSSSKNYIRRWTTDVKIFVEGSDSPELENELSRIVSDLNDIVDPIDFEIVSDRSEANLFVFFGSYIDFYNQNNEIPLSRLETNWGYFLTSTNHAVLYVDIYRANSQEQKHLLREELTQSLGLYNDTYDYPESIFYQDWTTTTEYAPIDRELIDMLYNE